MKFRYVSGLFLFLLITIGCLDYGYRYSYQTYINKQREIKNVEEENNSLSVQGKAKENTGYYLGSQNGYVIVYYSDKETIYQYTTILINSLPENLLEEVKDQKYISTTKELYSFLENYSS